MYTRLIFLLIIVFAVFLGGKNTNAGILVPWNPIASLNVGLDYQMPGVTSFSANRGDATEDLKKFENSNIYAGVRVLRYFGVEAGVNKINTDFQIDNDITNLALKQVYFDGKLFLPIISTIPFSLDGYVSYGVANISSFAAKDLHSGALTNSEINNAERVGLGLESTILGNFSARAGWYTLVQQIDVMGDKRLHAGYVGFSFYLI